MKDPSDPRVIESSAWIERMIWRNVLMLIFALGLVLIVYDFDHWYRYAVLVVGGLAPGLFLMAREQGERNIEENRRRNAPEGRRSDELPALRPMAGMDPTPTPPYGTVLYGHEPPAVRAARAAESDYPAEDEPPTGYR